MITIFAGRQSDDCVLRVSGHAQYAPTGTDIVCAGVSALTQALVITLEAFEVQRKCVRVEPGNVQIVCASSAFTDVLFYHTVLGLIHIARQYPKYVQMCTEGFFADDRQEGKV